HGRGPSVQASVRGRNDAALRMPRAADHIRVRWHPGARDRARIQASLQTAARRCAACAAAASTIWQRPRACPAALSRAAAKAAKFNQQSLNGVNAAVLRERTVARAAADV